MSIVPVLAVTLAIAKAFGFEEFLERQILQTFHEQKDVLTKAIEFSYSFIKHIKSQIIVGVGIIFLFFSVFGLLENIEKTLNNIWKVTKSRNLLNKILDYLAIIIFCPILFAASSSLTIFLNVQITKTFGEYKFLSELADYMPNVFGIVPFFLSWILFSFIYLFTPNTRIYFKPRIFAGILAGTLFQLWQIAYIYFQVVITSYSAIYGSFAALPLFLIWLQVDWIIFLLGAEIAANWENDLYFRYLRPDDSFLELDLKELIVLVLHQYVCNFQQGLPPPTINELAKRLGLPLSTIRKILDILEKEKVLIEVKGKKREKYQLSKNPELFTIKAIIDIYEKSFASTHFVKSTKITENISHLFKNLDEFIKNSELNITIKDLAVMIEKEKKYKNP